MKAIIVTPYYAPKIGGLENYARQLAIALRDLQGWDIVIVDEAHHLEWAPEKISLEYALVEELARKCAGLLLLTATPTQLGLAGHFARLRLLDPSRYTDFELFLAEAERFGTVAEIAGKIIAKKPLKAATKMQLFYYSRDGLRVNNRV